MKLEGGSVEFVKRRNGSYGIVAECDGHEIRLFPFESKEECERFLHEATMMPLRLYELLARNGVRA